MIDLWLSLPRFLQPHSRFMVLQGCTDTEPPLADISQMTWGPIVLSCEKRPNPTRRHDGWELSELTVRQKKIDRPLNNTARGELEAPVAFDPERLQFRVTHRVRRLRPQHRRNVLILISEFVSKVGEIVFYLENRS